jgi:hypothetical protein
VAVQWGGGGGGNRFDIAFVVTAIEFLSRIHEPMFLHLHPLLAALRELLNLVAFRVYHIQHPDFSSILQMMLSSPPDLPMSWLLSYFQLKIPPIGRRLLGYLHPGNRSPVASTPLLLSSRLLSASTLS